MKRTSLILAWALWAATQAAPGRTVRVPMDHSTVQGAINAAANGDTVLVFPGNYHEWLQIGGKNIVLRSTNPTSPPVVAATILNGTRTHQIALSVVRFAGTELTTCVLEGFTITRGDEWDGGGIQGNGTHATIRNNRITGNVGHNEGGGIHGCNGLVEKNAIFDNWCDGQGGGLARCNGIVQNNMIWGNSGYGALFQCNGVIRNNTIVGNQGWDVGGLLACNGTVRNCIIWGNSGPDQISETTPVVTYSCIQNWAGGGTGNITTDPKLADPAHGDFHLLSNSPCIDAGGAVPLSRDFDGDVRPYNFTPIPRGDGSNYDIGADEVVPRAPMIVCSPLSLTSIVSQGTNAATQTIEVWMDSRSQGTLAYVIDTTPSWLVATPRFGFSNGSSSRTTHRIGYRTASLPAGDHFGTVRITDPGATNSPVRIPVRVTVGSVAVVKPAAGEIWNPGGQMQIEWQSHGTCTSVTIQLRRPGYSLSLGTAPNADGLNRHSVSLPRTLSQASDYSIRVAWGSVPTLIYGDSGRFTIVPLLVGITWPMSGTIWTAGTSGTVQWIVLNLAAPSQMDMDVLRGGSPVGFLGRVPCRNGTNSATVLLPRSLAPGTNYQIRLRWVEDPTFLFLSQSFAVIGPLVNITRPTSSTIWTIGTSGTVTWTCANLSAPSQVDVDLWRAGGVVRYLGRSSCQNGTNSKAIFLPLDVPPATGYQIRLSWTENPLHSLFSLPFEVAGPSIFASPTAFVVPAKEGTNPPPLTLRVSNSRNGTLSYECLTTSAAWLHVAPPMGQSSGGVNLHTVSFDTASLPPSHYRDRIVVTGNATNSPVAIPVAVTVRRTGPPRTITVGQGGGYDFATIQAAIDAAFEGDEIVVSTGTYVENIQFLGDNIILRSSDPSSTPTVAQTIIDGNSNGSVVSFVGAEGTTCILAGFTITHGRARSGGGINGNGTLATIRNNLISTNSTWVAYPPGGPIPDTAGGGLFHCDGTIENNTISYNSSWGSAGTGGGGLYDCDGTIRNNTIIGNWATGGSDTEGGGLNGCDGTIRSNIISGNAARGQQGGWGGGLSRCGGTIEYNEIVGNWTAGGSGAGGGLDLCGGTIQNNIIIGNISTDDGGGICNCHGTIQNNIIAFNRGSSSLLSRGGGLLLCTGIIRNNTIYGNTVGGSGGGLCWCYDGQIRNCIIWGNAAASDAQLAGSDPPSYSCVENGASGVGNISSNPQLTDPAHGDFHLLPSSPCIDAGGTVALTVDFEGDPRPQNASAQPRGDGSHFDIGADEVPAVPIIASDPQAMFNAALAGTDAATQTLTVWNATGNTLAYVLDTTPSWLVAVPRFGFSDGAASRTIHQIGYRTASLPLGDHAATITITDPSAINSPLRIPVRMRMVTTATVTVLTPAGGESWAAGTRHRLDWESHGPWEWVRIEARRPGESRTLATAAPNHEGTNSLTVQLPRDLAPANDWRIWVAWAYCPNLAHDESEPFTVAPAPVFVITDPMSGSRWRVGDWQTVKWTCQNNPSQIRAYLAICRGTTIVRNWTSVACHDGANSATLRLYSDLQPASDYRLLMVWMGDSLIYYWSQPFTIIGPLTCSITRPSSTTKWAPGAWGAVQWTCQYNPDSDPMYLSIWRGGTLVRNWGTVPCHDGANSVNARMFPTLAPGSDYRVLMTWLRRRSVVFWSQPFEIVAPPTCAITNPTSSTSWASGSAVDIEWTCADNPNGDRMYLSIWRGNTIVRNWSSVPCQNGVNHVGLPLPAGLPPATDYRLRMSWMNDFSVYWWSPTFTVQ